MNESNTIYITYFVVIIMASIIAGIKFGIEIGMIALVGLMILNGIRGELMDIKDYIKEQNNEKN